MEIKRDILDAFGKWKESSTRKPMLLKGARQIGKTWAVDKFGESYEYYVRFDFDRNPELSEAFRVSKEPGRILKELEAYCDEPLLPGKTLIFFDEIQECEEAFNSLKYFCEDAPEYHIIAAGSLLGIAVRRKKMKVPVGKVDVVQHPEPSGGLDEKNWKLIPQRCKMWNGCPKNDSISRCLEQAGSGHRR